MTEDKTASRVSDERLAEMLAGLEGVTPGPWEKETNGMNHWVQTPGPFRELIAPIVNLPLNAAHIARCDPGAMRSILTELQSLRSLSSDSVSDGSKGVRIKPLNWDDQVDANGNWSSRATDEFGRKYRVSHEDAIDGDWYWFGALRFTSPEQAKAAAQRRAATPSEPTEAMLNAARDWSVKKYGQGIGNDAACGCWGAMYAAIDSRFLSARALDSGTGGQQPDGSEGAAIEIADAVLAWMVKHDFLDADAEYRDDDVIEVMNDLIAPTEPKAGVVSEDMVELLFQAVTPFLAGTAWREVRAAIAAALNGNKQ